MAGHEARRTRSTGVGWRRQTVSSVPPNPIQAVLIIDSAQHADFVRTYQERRCGRAGGRARPSGATGFAAHEDLDGTGLEAEQQPDAAFQVLSFELRTVQLLARSLMCRDELRLIVST